MPVIRPPRFDIKCKSPAAVWLRGFVFCAGPVSYTHLLHVQDSERAFCVYEALKRGVAHDVIYDITKIDWWFLDKLQHLADIEMGLKNGGLTTEKYLNAKRFGFLDKTIKRLRCV